MSAVSKDVLAPSLVSIRPLTPARSVPLNRFGLGCRQCVDVPPRIGMHGRLGCGQAEMTVTVLTSQQEGIRINLFPAPAALCNVGDTDTPLVRLVGLEACHMST